jgi:hypothetical protein
MKILPRRLFSSFAASTLLLCFTPSTLFASDDTAAREVRLSWVQGDVRLSRGNGKHTDLNKPWAAAAGVAEVLPVRAVHLLLQVPAEEAGDARK